MRKNKSFFESFFKLFVGVTFFALISASIGSVSFASAAKGKKKILIHMTTGPENPTVAALGFLVAKTAINEGHTVNLFLAGDSVKLLTTDVLDGLSGVGTGNLKEHFENIVKSGGKFYLSGMSAKARGMTEADLKGKPAEFAMPDVLVRLAVESDRMFTY